MGLIWLQDVTYTVKTRKFGVLTLLKKVDGYFKPGEITAMVRTGLSLGTYCTFLYVSSKMTFNFSPLRCLLPFPLCDSLSDSTSN